MEFLGIGYQELLVILLLLLVVVGPDRLPAMAYQIGRAVRQMQRYARAVRDEFSDEFDYLETQYRTVRGEIDTTRESLRGEQAKFQAEMRESAPSLAGPLLPPLENPGEPLTTFHPPSAVQPGNGEAPDPAVVPPGQAGEPPLVF